MQSRDSLRRALEIIYLPTGARPCPRRVDKASVGREGRVPRKLAGGDSQGGSFFS